MTILWVKDAALAMEIEILGPHSKPTESEIPGVVWNVL